VRQSSAREEREQRWTKEDREQRGQNAEGKREEHQDRHPTRARFGTSAVARAESVSLGDEKIGERRAEARGRLDERRNPRLGGSSRSERDECFAPASSERQIGKQPTSFGQPRYARRAGHKRTECELKREPRVETDDDRIEQGREIRLGCRYAKDLNQPQRSGDFKRGCERDEPAPSFE
jgi:hypothetical protein